MRHSQAVIKVTFVGAGSIEFTRNVVTDLVGYPEFHGRLHLSLYDISAERLAHAEIAGGKIGVARHVVDPEPLGECPARRRLTSEGERNSAFVRRNGRDGQ